MATCVANLFQRNTALLAQLIDLKTIILPAKKFYWHIKRLIYATCMDTREAGRRGGHRSIARLTKEQLAEHMKKMREARAKARAAKKPQSEETAKGA